MLAVTLSIPRTDAQIRLLVEEEGTVHPVMGVDGEKVLILDPKTSELRVSDSQNVWVEKGGEFLPTFVTHEYRAITGRGYRNSLEDDLALNLRITSSHKLNDVWIAWVWEELDYNIADLSVAYVGQISPEFVTTKALRLSSSPVYSRTRKQRMHFFVGDRELISNGTSVKERVSWAKKMMAAYLKKNRKKNAPTKPLLLPTPLNPQGILGKAISGTAVVRCKVKPDGSISDFSIRKTDNLRLNPQIRDAIAGTHFYPELMEGEPVSSEVDLLIEFPRVGEDSKEANDQT